MADLSIDLSDSPDPVPFKGQVTYTIDVANAGPATATGVTVLISGKRLKFVSAEGATCTREGPDVRCDLGSIESGASEQFTVVFEVRGRPSVSATSTVSANETDPDPADNSDTEHTDVAFEPPGAE